MSYLINVNGVLANIALEDLGDQAIIEDTDVTNGATAKVVFQCPYANRYLLIKALMGSVSSSGPSIIRNVPFAYPPSPNLVCTSVNNIVGLKPSFVGGWVTYQLARMTATFGFVPWQFSQGNQNGQNDPSGQPWTVTKIKATSEVFQPPEGAFKEGGGPSIDGSILGIVRPKTEISILRKFLPFVPLAQINLCSGRINKYPFQIANMIYPPGFVLFVSGSNEPSNDPLGNPTQDIEYSLIANGDFDWNTFLTPDNNWVSIVDKFNNPPFEMVDFSVLP